MQLVGTTIRIACNQAARDSFVNALGGQPPVLPRAGSVRMPCAIFLDDPSVPANLLTDLGNLVSAHCVIRAGADAAGPVVFQQVVPAAAFNRALTFAQWTGNAAAHFEFALTTTDTNLPPGPLHIAIGVTTADGDIPLVRCGTAQLRDYGIFNPGAPAAPDYTSWSKAEADARYAAKAAFLATLPPAATPLQTLVQSLKGRGARCLYVGDLDAGPGSWKDQVSGATATQATAAAQHHLTILGGSKFLDFDAADDGLVLPYTLAGVPASLDGWCMIVVEAPTGTGGTIRTIQSVSENCVLSVGRTGGNNVYWGGSISSTSPLASGGIHILSLALKPDKPGPGTGVVTARLDGADITAAGNGTNTWGQLAIGAAGSSSDPANTRVGLVAVVPYAQEQAAILDIAAYYGITTTGAAYPVVAGPRQITLIGDSITHGTGSSTGAGTADPAATNWPGRLLAASGGGWTGVNLAQPGERAYNLSDSSAQLYRTQYLNTAPRNVLCLMAGTNDIIYYTTVPSGVYPAYTTDVAEAAAIFARLQKSVQAAYDVGYDAVYLGTVLPSAHGDEPANFESVRLLLNAIIRANYPGGRIMDFGADSRIGIAAAASGTTYYDDGRHPNDAGYAIMGQIAAAAIFGSL